MPFFDTRRPQVFAHRGGAHLGPENTVAAFDLGMKAGADGLELDVHLSADGVPVVHHDSALDRTTNVSGPIADRTADELARADAGYRFERDGGPFAVGIGVPTLSRSWGATAGHRSSSRLVYRRGGPTGGEEIYRMAPATTYASRASGWRVRAARRASAGVAAGAAGEVRLAITRRPAGPPGGVSDSKRARGRRARRVVSPQLFMTHRRLQGAGLDRGRERLCGPAGWGVELITNRPDLAVRVRDEFLEGNGARP